MTIEHLVNSVLDRIRSTFYRDVPREFHRDRTALMKSIARYGAECERRGWDLSAEYVRRDLISLVGMVRQSLPGDTYLPVYLEAAVDRRIRLRAEEIQTEARRFDSQVKRTMAGIRSESSPASPAVPIVGALATLHRDLATRQKLGRAKAKAGRVQKQLGLFE